MICVGIDVAKDKHDCFILSSEGEVLADVFTIPNNAEGFDTLFQTICRCTRPADNSAIWWNMDSAAPSDASNSPVSKSRRTARDTSKNSSPHCPPAKK